jgi:DNA-binding protein H-NS
MTIDLKNLSLDELKSLQKNVEKAISSFEERRRKEALAAADAAARKAGFSLKELVGGTNKAAKTRGIPKYQHPENPELVWTGKGRPPAWFKKATESGTPADSLLISNRLPFRKTATQQCQIGNLL